MSSGGVRLAMGRVVCVVLALLLAACASVQPPTPTPEPSPTPTLQPTATATALPTATLTSSPTAVPASPSTPTPQPMSAPTLTSTPMPTPDGVERVVRVPILMYHHIAVPPADADAVRRDLSVLPDRFDEQLQYLEDQGYQSISLYDLNRYLQRGDSLPDKPIIFTFDDGYDDNFTNAFPLLVKHGFTGTFFLITEPIDSKRDGYMTWPQVTVMSRMGMDMEPHSYTHPDLSNKPTDYIVWQVLASKEAVEERTGQTCRFFSYPSGQFDQKVVDILRSANFWGAVSVRASAEQSTAGMFDLARIRVRGSYALDVFVANLNADW